MSYQNVWKQFVLFVAIVIACALYKPVSAQTNPITLDVGEGAVLIGNEVEIPITIQNLNQDNCLGTIQGRLMYEPDKLVLTNVLLGKDAPADATVYAIPTQGLDGQLDFGIMSTAFNQICKSGELARIKFRAKDVVGDSLVLLWKPFLNNVQTEQTTSGNITVMPKIRNFGLVTYGPNAIPLQGAIIYNSAANPISATSTITGYYSFDVPSGSTFTHVIEYPHDTTQYLSPLSVALTARCAFNFPVIGYPGECFKDVMDVDRNNIIQLYDAWLIARRSVGFKDPGSVAGTMMFSPGNVYYADMVRDVNTNQKAFVVGDVTMGVQLANTAIMMTPTVVVTATTTQIVVSISNAQFYGIGFELRTSGLITVTNVSSEIAIQIPEVYNPGNNRIQVVDLNQHQETQIVIDATSNNGDLIEIRNFQLDNGNIAGKVAETTVGQPWSTLRYTVNLPYLEVQ